MITTAVVNPAEWIPRIGHLLAANWAETGFDFPFAPNVGAYQRMFEAGIVFAVAAFSDAEIVGYCSVCVVPHTHNPAIVAASNDALFVAPQHRNGTAAGRVIRAAEAEAKRRGASRFTWHCRCGTPLAEMLTQHGYTPIDTVVMRGL